MYEYEYEPTPADTEIFLSDEPLNLMKSHILSQFEEPLTFKFDYVGSFIETYRYSAAKCVDEDDENDLNRMNDDFIKFMLDTFAEKLDLGFPDFDTKSTEDQHEMIHMVYRYFLINFKHNFASLCINNIDAKRDELVEMMPKKKDVTSLNLKKDMIDPDDIVIISSLHDVIMEIIFNNEYDVDIFIDDSDTTEPRLETDCMRDYYENFSLVGDFYPKYHNLITENFVKELESKIRNKIMKRYRKEAEK